LSKIDEIILPVERPYVKSSWHIYYIRLKNSKKRKEVFEFLREQNIGVQVHYIPIYHQPYYRQRFGYEIDDYPRAERYYKQAITLPLFPNMRDGEISFVIKAIKRSLKYTIGV
jgi:dTDP-4-amino-4,6-dideoxygalactose transaminase